ncbi:MAG: 2'-5' RNA ligase family protein [Dehalococcoidales bacterium]|nr:MAG: 2'-5' RNA ligase family protein [Dehalococcoidales bacterium]
MAQYAVAIVLPDEVERELDRLRGEFARHMANIHIPHITLAYPFESKADSAEIVEKLKQVAVRTKLFTLVLDGFDYFDRDSNVAYIAVVTKQPVIDLHYDINRSIDGLVADEYQGRFEREEFTPHVTIGARIPDDIFPEVKKRLAEEKVHYESDITSFSLFSIGEDRGWGVVSEFKLSG